MRFKKVNYKKLKLGDDAKVSKTYIRLVEKGTRLYHWVQKASETDGAEATPPNDVHAKKDFLATALENCQKFNEEFNGTFDK